MFNQPTTAIKERLIKLEQHLKEENPILVEAVDEYRKLSRVAYATGILGRDESYATQISWWPLISVLGTFSAGKSTFINHYLGFPLQDTGNQAVDDKFTVICYSGERDVRVLPGLALDADPRFPFYQTSEELEKVAPGEGKRIDAYLQLKTSNSETLKGKILIDSPGFDADSQRSATLKLSNHIIGLSDLVLVFFDARHPEPGAMGDTLAHLVRDTVDRNDSSKFLYVLNQIDTTAREDNPEEVVGAWQRALAREGLTAGRFYCIYNPDAAVPIDDAAKRRRFEWKRDQDMSDILQRIDHVSVERAYRIIGDLDKRAHQILDCEIPKIRRLMTSWRNKVLWGDGALMFLVLLALGVVWFNDKSLLEAVGNTITEWWSDPQIGFWISVGAGATAVLVHFVVRYFAARNIENSLEGAGAPEETAMLKRELRKNTRFWRSIFELEPAGWGKKNQQRLQSVIHNADRFVQRLNDKFTDPSGKRTEKETQTEMRVVSGEVLPASES